MGLIPHPADLRAPRRPPTPAEAAEYPALRLALLILAARAQADTYENDTVEPIPGDFRARNRWEQRALAPLTRRSPTVALVARLVDITGPRMAWDEPTILRRHLRILTAEAARLGRRMRARRRA